MAENCKIKNAHENFPKAQAEIFTLNPKPQEQEKH